MKRQTRAEFADGERKDKHLCGLSDSLGNPHHFSRLRARPAHFVGHLPTRSALMRVVKLRFASLRCAPLRAAKLRPATRRSAPMKSGTCKGAVTHSLSLSSCYQSHSIIVRWFIV